MGNLIKDNKCFEAGASKTEVEEIQKELNSKIEEIRNQFDSKVEEIKNQLNNKIDKADEHISSVGWDDVNWVPYAKVDENSATFFLASSDNNALKFNWVGDRVQVIINGTAIGYMSIYE